MMAPNYLSSCHAMTAWMLPVLAHTSITSADVAPQLSSYPVCSRHVLVLLRIGPRIPISNFKIHVPLALFSFHGVEGLLSVQYSICVSSSS